MGILSNLSIGIVSGLVTTFLVLVLHQIWKTIINPWYEDHVYQDARIEGRWESKFVTASGEDKETIELERTGHSVRGTILCTEGPDKGRAYNFNGTFRNLLLTASYVADKKKHLDRGSFSLKLVHNGEKFEGHTAYYKDPEDKVASAPYTWERDEH